MKRLKRVLLTAVAAGVVALVAAACGTEYAKPPKSDQNYSADAQAAQLFNQRCGGHTFSYAGTYGSGENPRTYLTISGPNFDVRCERPVERVLYAIENGGFSGAYMPQNILVGKQAREVAMFVAQFSGRAAPREPGVTRCQNKPMGTLPPAGSTGSGS